MLLTPPRHLPVDHLSLSSIALYQKCVIRWKRRYIDAEPEPISGAAIAGRAFGNAARDSYGNKVQTGQLLSTADVLDAYSDSWELALAQDGELVDWEDEKPGRIKDSGYRVLPVYHQLVAPTIKPLAVERRFTIKLPDVDWTVTGYMDVECADEIPDLKLRTRSKGHISQAEADSEPQPGFYLLARRAEGFPARNGFAYHSSVRAARGIAVKPGDVAVTYTQRTDEQLDALVELIYQVAAEIQWRMEYDVWTPPPATAWWCSRDWCGFWDSCRFGGALRAPANGHQGPRPARRLADARVMDAVRATIRKDGTTTARRVGQHLGISARSASARLAKMPGVTSARPTKASGRGAGRVVSEVSGPRVYRIANAQEEVTVT